MLVPLLASRASLQGCTSPAGFPALEKQAPPHLCRGPKGRGRNTTAGGEEQTGLGAWVPSAHGWCCIGAARRMGTSSWQKLHQVPVPTRPLGATAAGTGELVRATGRTYLPHHSPHPQFLRRNAKNYTRARIRFHSLKS